MRVKLFSNRRDAPELEAEINSWLTNNSNIQISHVKQSYAYDGKRVFLYTKTNVGNKFTKNVKSVLPTPRFTA